MKAKNIPSQNYTIGKGIGFGAIGGVVAGLVMAPFLMLTAMIVGMPADTMPVAMGTAFGATTQNEAMMLGFGMHMLTSVLIGVIFGAIVAAVPKLRITSFGKGIGEGVIAGMIAFAVLFIPLSMFVMPPVLVQMMMATDPSITSEQQAMGMLEQGMPVMFGMGIVEHLVFGAVLGAVTSALVLRVGTANSKEKTSAITEKFRSGEGVYECNTCHNRFDTVKEREDHIRTEHHGTAA